MLYIDPVVVVIGTIAFDEIVVKFCCVQEGVPGVFEDGAWAVTDPV